MAISSLACQRNLCLLRFSQTKEDSSKEWFFFSLSLSPSLQVSGVDLARELRTSSGMEAAFKPLPVSTSLLEE